jgi:hypothetical protein
MATVEECRNAVVAVFALLGVESRGLDEKGNGMLMLGNLQLGLSWVGGALRCDAPVYTFRNAPRAGLLERLAARARQMDLGPGVTVELVQPGGVLVLRRAFAALPAPPLLLAEWKSLLGAAARFSDEGISGL